MKILVTGGAGFIGSNFIYYILDKYSCYEITNLDKLTYAGNLENLKDIRSKARYRFVRGDITDKDLVSSLLQEDFSAIVNFAAESHVDRSILDASPFIETNTKGTQVLLEAARNYGLDRFLQISTDEVYDSISTGRFTEESPLIPTSPYAASKAAADLICQSYWRTYQFPVVITRCSNNFGPYQFPEKLIPLAITNALENRSVPLYGTGSDIRDWIYVTDHCRALDLALHKGTLGEIYNIGATREKTNLELISELLHILEKPQELITFVADRPGHDRRYSMDTTKINRELGWEPIFSFDRALEATVRWYQDNEAWWRKVKNEDYQDYYQKLLQRGGYSDY